MKSHWPLWACAALMCLAAGCTSNQKTQQAVTASSGKVTEKRGGGSVVAASTAKTDAADTEIKDEWEDEANVVISDPIEPVNRGTFWLNHQIYQFLLKPFAKTYKFLLPEFARRGINNAYENVRFPVRLVNHTLQAHLDRAALETGKFLVNTTAGAGGLMTPAEKIPALAGVPKTDTGQTLAKWGLGHGAYVVVPVIGPSSTRDVVGLAGDAALNPISWLSIVFGGAAWTLAVSTPAGARSLPEQMEQYDTVSKTALDRYLAVRTAYIQHRDAATKRDIRSKPQNGPSLP